MTSFFDALEFLTRMRVRRAAPDLAAVARSQVWFPVVGLLIGLLLLGIDRALTRVLPDVSIDVILVVSLAMVTGALHLDGLADAADGLFGAHDRERRLAIMRDVHAGTYAIVAVVCVLALKWAGLVALPGDVRLEAIVLAPCLARFAMVASIAAFPYARESGMGASFRARAWPAAVVVSGGVAVVASVGLLGFDGVLVLMIAVACAFAIGAYAVRAVGGMTGDLYGAVVEVTEAVVLLGIAVVAG